MRRPAPTAEAISRALARYDGLEDAEPEPLGTGLINDTFLLRSARGRLVLQRVSPIFDARIHENIDAVTRRLLDSGMETPELVPTREGHLFAELGDGSVFRVMTHVDGASFDAAASVEQVRSAGRLIGRFHAALDELDHEFVGLRLGVHDTARHLAALEAALSERDDHRLYPPFEPLAREVLLAARRLPSLPELPSRACHGDLKLNNVLFESPSPPGRDRALCLVDLDTLGPQHLAYELGDAWRSWCNRAGEDDVAARLDLKVFEASLDGYSEGIGRPLSEKERLSLLLGPEWVSLELAARFAVDVVEEGYFGWDAKRFETAGDHNLVRARGQHSLHRAFVETRAERAKILGVELD